MIKLRINNLVVNYLDNKVIEVKHLEMSEGEYIVVLGGNGSGKSTLIKALLGVIPFAGEIYLNDQILQQADVAKYFGYVPQHSTLDRSFPITVAEVIELECALAHQKCEQSVAQHLARMNAEHLQDKLIGELSGGELQRVLIAKALVANPRIIILDEPTNNLDVDSQAELYDCLKKLPGSLIIHVTHDLHEIEHLGRDTRHLEISNGSLMDCKRHDH